MAKVLGIFAHPDDETFGPGGTLALWAKAGAEIHLLCVTRGEMGRNESQDKTADRRERELREAAKILGVQQVEFLDYVDGSLSNETMIALETPITKKIRDFEPDTIVTYDLNGVSGHLDHIAVASATTQAFRHTGIAQEIYYFTLPRAYSDQVTDYFVYFPDGRLPEEIDVAIDVSLAWETRMQAMYAHESQREDVQRIISRETFQRRQEHFVVKTLADLQRLGSGTSRDDTATQ